MASDHELIARCGRGDARAFRDLFDRHAAVLFRYAFGISRNADDAQELVQDTFLSAWRRLADIHLVGESMLPWLIVTCRNHGANLARRKVIRQTVPIDDSEFPTSTVDTLDRLAGAEELRWVVDAIGQLGATDRRIVELCLFDGRSYADAADVLGLSVSVITKRVQRTRARLRQERTTRDREATS
jgi:RNA polymerase sigma factor (sigma-70 family)